MFYVQGRKLLDILTVKPSATVGSSKTSFDSHWLSASKNVSVNVRANGGNIFILT